MAYIGVGYNGADPLFLRNHVDTHMPWLRGDRVPRFYGDCFVVLYDSNTAREFVKKCRSEAEQSSITVYQMERVPDCG